MLVLSRFSFSMLVLNTITDVHQHAVDDRQTGTPLNLVDVSNFLGMIPFSNQPCLLCNNVHASCATSLLVCQHLLHICCCVCIAAAAQ